MYLKYNKEEYFVDSHFAPQISFLIYDYDFIGRMENFEKDFQFIKEKLDLNETYNVKIHKTDSKSKLREYYDEDCEKIVLDLYKEDFIRFNYSTKLD